MKNRHFHYQPNFTTPHSLVKSNIANLKAIQDDQKCKKIWKILKYSQINKNKAILTNY